MLEHHENEKSEDLPELSESYKLEVEKNGDVTVFERSIMGEVDSPCLYAAIDDNDQYVAG